MEAPGTRSRRRVVSRFRLQRHGDSVNSLKSASDSLTSTVWCTNIARGAKAPART